MAEKKYYVYYVIEFIYTDNDQIFQTGAQLDDEEKAAMERLLQRYVEAGAIKEPSVYQPKTADHDFDGAVNEVMEALESQVHNDDRSECQNCERQWPDNVLINPIPDLTQRVAAGEPMPSGECPACGALCHPKE